jgi:hypothetical protein
MCIGRVGSIIIAVFLFCLLMGACSSVRISPEVPPTAGSGFVRKEIAEIRRVVILPFDGDSKGESADAFTSFFREKFPWIEVVERKQVQSVFRDLDFPSGYPDKETRTRVEKAFEAQALVSGSVYYPSILRWLLQVRIIDVKTGSWIGQASVEVGFSDALGREEGCRVAVESLVQR